MNSSVLQNPSAKVTTAMIFDYDAIIEKYGININIVTEQSGENQEEPMQQQPEIPAPSISFPEDDE